MKHGFMNVNSMRGDTSLPLHPAAALDHITRTFLSGSTAIPMPMPQIEGAGLGKICGIGESSNDPSSGTSDASAGVGSDDKAGGGGGSGRGGTEVAAAAAAGTAAANAAIIVRRGFDGGDERVQAWAEEASGEFPTRRAAEDRVFRVCVELTKSLTPTSSARVRCYNERGW